VVGIPTPLKNDGVKVSWDDGIPNVNGKIIQMFQTTNQIIYSVYELMKIHVWDPIGILWG
jgi:hypothetical protein